MRDEESGQSNIPSEDAETKDKDTFDAERIKDLRDRLYARGGSRPQGIVRHGVPAREVPFPQKETLPVTKVVPPPLVPPAENAVVYDETMKAPQKKKLRKKIALVGVLFFLIATVVSILLMFSGTNTISGENITIAATGPIAVGGGDEFSYQVSVANQNTVPISSATLIVEYPKGAQNVLDGKDLITERKQLDTVNAGELINIPLSAKMFGEENEEKEIKISIDYRVAGSNATFHKEATPLRFKISTSPVIITFDSVKSISSGQEFETKLIVQSNSPAPLTDLVVKVNYPVGFDFSEAKPVASSGEDVWKIAKLNPSEKYSVTIKGLITGYENETRKFSASVGVPEGNNSNVLASVLSQAKSEIMIEQPFVDVKLNVNGSKDPVVVVDTHEVAIVEVQFENTLENTIYDGKIQIMLEGDALDEFNVEATDGFYDSSKNVITWDGVEVEALKEILPGKINTVSFALKPNTETIKTPEISIKANITGKRLLESNVPEGLIGTTGQIIKLESIPTLTAMALYKTGAFTNTGPTPPVAEKVTQYTFALFANAGANDIAGAEVTAVLPQYVNWLDLVTGDEDVTYNATTRTVKWIIGNIDANTEKTVSMQVSFTPSLTQVATTPTILEVQRLKATDRFTGTVVRADHPALTTSLYGETDAKYRDGRVRVSE